MIWCYSCCCLRSASEMAFDRPVVIVTSGYLIFPKFSTLDFSKMPKVIKLPNPPKVPFQSNSVWLFRHIHTNQVIFSPHRVIKVPLAPLPRHSTSDRCLTKKRRLKPHSNNFHRPKDDYSPCPFERTIGSL